MDARTLALATAVLMQRERHGRQQARQFLARCDEAEIRDLAACDGAAAWAELMDNILRRQESDDPDW